MEENILCPKCHTSVRSTDYYCFNCGKNLKSVPPATTPSKLTTLFLKSIFLPPFGIYWALPYLKQSDKRSKRIGIIVIIVTASVFIYTIIAAKNLMNTFSAELERQLNSSVYF